MFYSLSITQKNDIQDKLSRSKRNSSFEASLPIAPHNFKADMAYYELSSNNLHFMITAVDSSSGKSLTFTAALPVKKVVDGTIPVSFQPSDETATALVILSDSMHGGRSGFFSVKYTSSTNHMEGSFEFVDHLNQTFKGIFNLYKLS